jgi:ribonucleoside-diphosphate reductase alpha chain
VQNGTESIDAHSKSKPIVRLFTRAGEDPYAQVAWETRRVRIEGAGGKVIFAEDAVECPASWSQTAVTIVASKYFRGSASGKAETSVRALIKRVVDTIHEFGRAQGYFSTAEDGLAFRDELTAILLLQYAAFNSPVWFNVGVQPRPQCSACFILSVDDTLESLLTLQDAEARLFKYGSGTGTNFSKVRSKHERLSGGGIPSGPVSFMRAYDAWANVIKSGGKTRRAAKMQILNAEHPDIREFIECKRIEEEKAWKLIDAGLSADIGAIGGAYDSVSFQNANLSVRVTDDFMNAVVEDRTFFTKRVTNGEPCEELKAREILSAISEATHICGDPGLQFDTTINAWHTCPESGRINASNPCSEYMHLDNSACNLSSINLLKFLRDDGTFDVRMFRHTVDIMITAQDIVVEAASYPTPQIERCAHDFRQLGLGYANLGALVMSLGHAYDSPEARAWAAALTALMTGQAYLSSARIAKMKGPFRGYEPNSSAMRRVMKRHEGALHNAALNAAPEEIRAAAFEVWESVIREGSENGYRNSQATVLAPTGTIGFMMDCDTTGIEPDIALIKYKRLAGGGTLKLVNQSVERGLRALDYPAEQRSAIIKHIEEHDTIEGAPHLDPSHLAVFDCALRPAGGVRHIHYRGHINMMAAVQPFLSGAISKTVNLPKEATVQEIFNVYIEAWRLGLKAVALYRDSSKRHQPLSLTDKQAGAVQHPRRRRLPEERNAITHRFSVAGLEGYVTVGLYEDGSPGEIFLVVAKEGSTLSGVMDAFATGISLSLQHGVPLKTLVRKFAHMRFEPAGYTGNKTIPFAKSIVDYVFRWLGSKFLSPQDQAELGLTYTENGESAAAAASNPASTPRPAAQLPQSGDGGALLEAKTFRNIEDAPPCTSCGSGLMVRQGACYVCLNCGSQGGCG